MKFKVLDKTTSFKRFFQVDIYQLQHELFAGGWSEPFTREIFERGNAVAILLHDPVSDTLLLIEQFRAGAMNDKYGPWMQEIVAGIVEAGETKEDVARREALEEAGCEVKELEFILDFYPSAGGSTELISLYYGAIDLSTLETGIHGLPSENEDIKTSIISRSEALNQLREGKIRASIAIIALQWLALNK